MFHEMPSNYVVLVVDDSPDSLRFLTDALDNAGMTVLVATDGEEALARINDIRPDIVLLDAMMPGLDGFETCGRLKDDARFRDLPVIFMTALSDTEHVVKGLSAGGVDYVTKPIIVEELIARIRVHGKNARLTQSTWEALDAAGGALLATDRKGRIKWTTKQAETHLRGNLQEDSGNVPALPPALREWIERSIAALPAPQPALTIEFAPQLTLSYVATIGSDEVLLSVSEHRPRNEKQLFKERFSLTPRESDVLLWIAKGKSNRDIAEILGLSPRTVNKHLEQIYAKLGVENRTAAAAIAMEALSH